MSLNTTIRQRTEALELNLAGEFVLPKRLVLEKGYILHGSLGSATAEGYYTARVCKRMKQPVTDEEIRHTQHYAMMKDCYQDNCILDGGKYVRPCIPVFFRGIADQGGEASHE